jgi:outer membrane protein assembly factor BamB
MLNIDDGQPLWQQSITIAQGAFAIQRMIDIDADPVLFEHHIYAATYQGNVASLTWSSGRTLWSRALSSYTGMAATNDTVYISDAKSNLWAFNAETGMTNWEQTKLYARMITGPAAIDRYLVVGDGEGYLHWLSKLDGHIAGRIATGSAAIYTAPLVANETVYVITSKGKLLAYTLSRGS